MISSQVAMESKKRAVFSYKKILLLFEDNMIGRMLNHLFSLKGFETKKSELQGDLVLDSSLRQKCDMAIIDLKHPSMMSELCRSCMEKKWEDFPKIVLSTSPEKQATCKGKVNCVVMTKPFKTEKLIKKINSFSNISIENIRHKIYQYYN